MPSYLPPIDDALPLLMEHVNAIARRDSAFRQKLINRLSSPTTHPVEIERTQSPATLKKSAEAYKSKLDADVRIGELSMSNSNRQKASLSVMFRNVCDQPLIELSYAPLAEMVAKIKDRKTNGLSPDSIQTAIRDIRLFFGWLEDSGHWIPQFNTQRLFRVRKHKLMTIAESHLNSLGGKHFEWDAEITVDEPNRRIAWRSLPGADIENAGQITFSPGLSEDRGTEVHVRMDYIPPAGRFGHLIASLLGNNPKRVVREDLRNFKRIMEIGEIPTIIGQTHGTCTGQGKPYTENNWRPLFT